MPIFNQDEQPEKQLTVNPPASDSCSQALPLIQPEPAEKSPLIKTIRKVGSSFTPSIKDALSGKKTEPDLIDEIQKQAYSEYETFSEPFTLEQLTEKWTEFLKQNSDRPNLISTLSSVPELTEGNKLLLKIGNSVQEEEVRLIKPELVNWLRKELRNSGIEITTRLEKMEQERVHFNDSEKLQIMIQKNPELFELKKKFNLDFSE